MDASKAAIKTASDFPAGSIERHVLEEIEGFLGDPPDNEFQRGYLAALLNVATEGLGFMNSVKAAHALLLKAHDAAKAASTKQG